MAYELLGLELQIFLNRGGPINWESAHRMPNRQVSALWNLMRVIVDIRMLASSALVKKEKKILPSHLSVGRAYVRSLESDGVGVGIDVDQLCHAGFSFYDVGVER
ncbi:uncharacterized protein EAE98_003825 [Botrytis deweyae]|uniref:Uncharacterized protein n=2 Tax=Botrytis TaxID=33196 RepID=A0A4Z1JGT5_9HELO|nr:uncharacterized protein EAE98_003825 [Botrytis deweyae]KAF7932526.1 hypothetical protein EAE98_003825 [Botrytis deweyae]KAF7939662.1 hypothetical protein EAE99_001467 [Botrytis elliptica]TGO70760.1 hypothetical protein BELL_0671g00050 [Botrytis elliptica]